MEIIFLGTGGGRWVTLLQKLRTGGFRIHGDNINIHIDPGPGAMLDLKEAGVNPFSTHACVVSHSHPDHYTDAELMVEAMTRAMTKHRGSFIGSLSAVDGADGFRPVLSNYHTSQLSEIMALKAGDKTEIRGVKLEALPTRHSDPTAIGMKFNFKEGTIAYTCDTEYFSGMESSYTGARVLIANVIRPEKKRIKWHLCRDDLIKILKKTEPELVVMQHFGMTMLNCLDSEARAVEKATGVKTIAAKDFMKIIVKKDIKVQYRSK